jgi:hypothetical protein
MYNAAEEAMRAAGRWPADGQPLKFRKRGAGVPEQEIMVAQRLRVSTPAYFHR